MTIMKKIILLLSFVLFVFLIFSPLVLAQADEEDVASPSTESTDSAEKIEYQLPYPGMLPDHPLYKLKVLRDKILLFLIRDSLKKAAKHLHMADKEFFMALKLVEKGKIPLAQHTAFKAEHHMTLLTTELRQGISSGRNLDLGFLGKARQAALKHQEVLDGMMAKTDNEETVESLKTIKEFSVRNDKAVYEIEEELKEMAEEQKEFPEEEFPEEEAEEEVEE